MSRRRPPKTILTSESPSKETPEYLVSSSEHYDYRYDEEAGFVQTSPLDTKGHLSETTESSDDTAKLTDSVSTRRHNGQRGIKINKSPNTSRRGLDVDDPDILNRDDFDDTYSLATENKSSGKNSVGEREDTVREEFKELSKRKTINRMKIIVMLILLAAATVVTVLVWFFANNAETDDFKSQYNTLSRKVLVAFKHNMDMKVWTAYTLSSVFTSRFGPYGQENHHDGVWPNVTLFEFYEQSKGSLQLAHADIIYFAPLLTNETKESWTEYAEKIHSSGLHDGPHHDFAETAVGGSINASGEDHYSMSVDQGHGGHMRRLGLFNEGIRQRVRKTDELLEDQCDVACPCCQSIVGFANAVNYYSGNQDSCAHVQESFGLRDNITLETCDGDVASIFLDYANSQYICSGGHNDHDRSISVEETKRCLDIIYNALSIRGNGECTGTLRCNIPIDYNKTMGDDNHNGVHEESHHDMSNTTLHHSDTGTGTMESGHNETGDMTTHHNSTGEEGHHHDSHEHAHHDTNNMTIQSNETIGDDHHTGMTTDHNGTMGQGHHETSNMTTTHNVTTEEGHQHDSNGQQGHHDTKNTTIQHNGTMGEHHNDEQDAGNHHHEPDDGVNHNTPTSAWGIYRIDPETKNNVPEGSNSPYYFPMWQIIPEEGNEKGFLYNVYSDPILGDAIDHLLELKDTSFTSILFQNVDYHGLGAKHSHHDHGEPTSMLFSPIFRNFTSTEIVGIVGLDFNWRMNFMGLLPGHVGEMCIVLESSQGEAFTFILDGDKATFAGKGDLHDPKYGRHVKKAAYVAPDVFGQDSLYQHTDHSHTRRRGEESSHDSHHDEYDGISEYTIRVYPTEQFEDTYTTKKPVIFAATVALIFLLTSITFILYDCLVESRQEVVMKRAVQTSRVVNSLFPATVRERLFSAQQEEENLNKNDTKEALMEAPTVRLRNFLLAPTSTGSVSNGGSSIYDNNGDPIADMFPNTTILFADIAGFTAWSSEREPHQVFELLETIYKDFDIEAKKHGVFKIETIGDCYVAATGLPNPQSDHAVIMSRFAQRCLNKFQDLTKEMAITLGPGTANLGLRVGIHSGAVTAGVLRGEKSRFQVFGDTMNTASRMESSGKKNLIQISPETAQLLTDAGKGHWMARREDIVVAKGKGEIQTYWLRPRALARKNSAHSMHSSSASVDSTDVGYWGRDDSPLEDLIAPPPRVKFSRRMSQELQPQSAIHSYEDEVERLVKWNAAVLESLLVKVMNHRNENTSMLESSSSSRSLHVRRFKQHRKKENSNKSFNSGNAPSTHRREQGSFSSTSLPEHQSMSGLMIDEIEEEVPFAPYKPWTSGMLCKSRQIDSIGEVAHKELLLYVARVAGMYRRVHFHNFEHASHVTMSANKLMKKICARNWSGYSSRIDKSEAGSPHQINLFFKTFGISSDPLAQFVVVFAALVHDVDHLGVPNAQVIKEAPDFAAKYRNISVAEQNSIHVAWDLLLEPEFENLRKCMFVNEYEMERFKHLLIHIIMATDIADKNRMKIERERWDKAFSNFASWEDEWRERNVDELWKVDVSLKATALLEQLMLASDIAHTMQHWITFVKWNERLFKERMVAFMENRGDSDPRIGWYKGEIGFFDFYIIPLAKRLKECDVFGSAGDEYLGYALKNRQEWTEKGQDIVEKYYQWSLEQGADRLPEYESPQSSDAGGE